mmetsp:Transcript_4527/g.6421  ORF Transcript_4527/g.6421 Transcript_4527/m.6421 type:complete len:512 (-) Transcript_4527:346-1881(-)
MPSFMIHVIITIVHQTIHFYLIPIYLLLSFATLSSLFIPFLNDLALHGKTRQLQNVSLSSQDSGCRSGSRIRTSSSASTYSTTTRIASRSSSSNSVPKLKGCSMSRGTDSTSTRNSAKISATMKIITHQVCHNRIFLIPKQKFGHFYLTGLIGFVLHMLSLKMTVSSLLLLPPPPSLVFPYKEIVLLMTLLFIHLMRRYMECCHIHSWKSYQDCNHSRDQIQNENHNHDFDYDCDHNINKKHPTTGMMHLSSYILGLLHYILLPFVFFSPIHFQLHLYDNNNNYNTNYYDAIQFLNHSLSSPSSSLVWQSKQYKNHNIISSTIAAVLCLYAQYQQYRHHKILANYRKSQITTHFNNDKQDNSYKSKDKNMYKDKGKDTNRYKSNKYVIPNGAFFHYLSCPHYAAEIIIYASLLYILSTIIQHFEFVEYFLLQQSHPYHQPYEQQYQQQQYFLHTTNHTACTHSRQQYTAMTLLLWVIVNLSISAHSSHKWYKQHFGSSYPSHRKALIPFLF